MKTLRRKEKLLVRANFSFDHNVFKSRSQFACQTTFSLSVGDDVFDPTPDCKSLALSKLK